jgi:type IV pilus assembly protein PilC
MFGNAQIDTKALVELCRRLSTSLKAGVDIRRNFEREVANSHGRSRRAFQRISDAVNRGEKVSDGIADTGNFFPPLFRELVEVGEDTGHLAEVLRQLSQHYQHQLELKRTFRKAITWPVVELCSAILVVGILIYVMGMLPGTKNEDGMDLLGLGLKGTPGLIKYAIFLATVAITGFWFYWQATSGAWWTGGVQKAVMNIPKIGNALALLAISRFAWSLRLTLDTDMPLRRALELAFRSTHNAYYESHLPDVLELVRQGESLTETLESTGVFPEDFLNVVRVGEDSGQLPETLGALAENYQEDARRAMGMLTQVAGGLVWLCVAGVIIMIVFRIMNSYLGLLNSVMPK